jgi:tetratricopeptide (TPR) repeat protein
MAISKLEESLQWLGEETFNWGLDHAYLLDLLGDAYQLNGQKDKAARTYARIRELISGRVEWGAVYSRSFYKLGKLYEQLGKKAEARKEFTKFLDLWKDADPGLPEVEDAKKRLAAIF